MREIAKERTAQHEDEKGLDHNLIKLYTQQKERVESEIKGAKAI